MAEDVWIPSSCSLCYNQCGIVVHRVDGVVTKIEGNPESPLGLGRLCPKGLAGINVLYDPYRVNKPLKRTNPEKGRGIDPKWTEITWEEALDIVVEKLKKIRAEDPRKLVMTGCVPSMAPVMFGESIFMPAFGSSNIIMSNGHQCGNAEHMLAGTLHAALTTNPDLDYCNYLIVFGSGCGTHAYYAFTSMAQKLAEARSRGMKLVVVDPVMAAGAEKADEWLPIKPGTDGALAMAMLNVLLNEAGIYDREYLQHHTNAPYLIKPDGHYARDPQSGKPLIFDPKAGCTKAYDDPTVAEFALEGSYWVAPAEAHCQPSFQLLKDCAKSWTVEKAAEITSLPAETIHRIALEFGRAAQVGSTITIEGHSLPYRPTSLIYFKGAHGHDHAWITSLAVELLAEVLGASDVPGSIMGSNPACFGHPETGLPRWKPREGPDGLLMPGLWWGGSEPGFRSGVPYPPTESRPPVWLTLKDIFPTHLTSHLAIPAILEPEKYGIPYRPEMLINYGSNLLMSVGDPAQTEAALKTMFTVSFNLWLDETSELADIVLPDASYLERLDPSPNWHHHHFPVGMGDWGWQLRQPAVSPLGQRRHFSEVMLEIGERVGILDDMYMITNRYYSLRPPYALERGQRYSWEQISDNIYKYYFGPQRGLEWFKKNGVVRWPKKVEEVYWKQFTKARVPVYFEWLIDVGKQVEQTLNSLNLTEIDTSDFSPLPNWKPCYTLRTLNPEYPLQAVYYRVAWHTFSMTYENPWLDEISQRCEPYSYLVSINRSTAEKLSLKDNDLVWVKAAEAGRVLGRVKLTEGIHPGVVGIANNGGHWARYMPFARGKGVFFEALLPITWKAFDSVSCTMDCDAPVKVFKPTKAELQRWGTLGWAPE